MRRFGNSYSANRSAGGLTQVRRFRAAAQGQTPVNGLSDMGMGPVIATEIFCAVCPAEPAVTPTPAPDVACRDVSAGLTPGGYRLDIYYTPIGFFDPVTDPSIAADPFNTSNYPPLLSSGVGTFANDGIFIYPGITDPYLWSFTFYLVPPFATTLNNIIIGFSADDAVAFRQELPTVVPLVYGTVLPTDPAWAYRASPGFGGNYVFSNVAISIGCVKTQFKLVTANGTQFGGYYVLGMFYIQAPGPGPWTYAQLDAQPKLDLSPYMYYL